MKAIVNRVIQRMGNGSIRFRSHYWDIRNHLRGDFRDVCDVGLRPDRMNGTIFTLERSFERNKANYKQIGEAIRKLYS